MARLLTASHWFYLVTIGVAQRPVNLFKLSQLLLPSAHSSTLLTPPVPWKPASDSFRKFLLDANGETVGRIFYTGASFKVEFFVLRKGYVMIVS